MGKYAIHHCSGEHRALPYKYDIAMHTLGDSYVPFYDPARPESGQCGRQVMDDFGNLQQALPQHQWWYDAYLRESNLDIWGLTYGLKNRSDIAYFSH